ncbi:MAG: Gfo/Idh/MocA family oxidoreductase, partial [Planctomycetota bacterium]
MAERHGCPVLETIDDVVAAKPDAVSIAVPTIYHRETAEPLLRAGIACLIEKPLAQDRRGTARRLTEGEAQGPQQIRRTCRTLSDEGEILLGRRAA